MTAPKPLLAFERSDAGFRLTRLCGLPLAVGGTAQVQGPAVVKTDAGLVQGAEFVLAGTKRAPDSLNATFRVAGTALGWRSAWRADPATGVVSRRDTLVNRGDTPAMLLRALIRVSLPPGRYECYTQTGRWCGENQGAWQPLHAGVRLAHLPGRTTEGATPFLAIRRVGTDEGVVFHVLPRGNWTIRVTPVPAGGDLPFAVVELGLADENLRQTLAPGEAFELPEILFQPLTGGEPHRAAPALHRYLLTHHFAGAKPAAPVVYNTWFDQFEILDVPRLRRQLAAAKDVGCEVFTIDAGWYGAGGPNWGAQVGDWREKTEAAFCGQMCAFADEVRAAGLGFGLWMEPERFGAEAPIRAAHPEWFISAGDAARIDLTQPAAYTFLRGEIGRLVETYQLAWMKLDFNFTLDADASGAELADYTAAWYRLLDEIRAAYPETFFEGCASGAMRGDLAMVTHVDGHFLSDTVNPVDVLRISQGAWLRLPPGKLTRWCVVRSAGQVLPRYTKSVADSPPTILTPCGAIWEPAESMDMEFALLTAMPGMFGLSGDLAGLAPEQRASITAGIAFYSRWRRVITGAVAHLLTPPEPLSVREGWIGVQLQAPDGDISLVFVYRLGAAGAPPPLRVQNLQNGARYTVTRGFSKEATKNTLSGQTLMTDGLLLTDALAGSGHGADVFVVRRTR